MGAEAGSGDASDALAEVKAAARKAASERDSAKREVDKLNR